MRSNIKKYHLSTLLRYSFAAMLIVAPLLLSQNATVLTRFAPESGDPDGSYRVYLYLDKGTGKSAENYANYHVCSNPSYTPSNWTEEDGTLGDDTSGGPSWISGFDFRIPALAFARANGDFVRFSDSSASCTTGNDPYDHGGTTDTFHVGAWIKPIMTLTCSDIGNQYVLASKWDSSNNDCSYRIWLEAVDTNGSTCDADSDVGLNLRAEWDDAGASFSCASSCEVERISDTSDDAPRDQWTHFWISWEPDSTISFAGTYINGKIDAALAGSITCEDGSAIADPFTINNSDADLYFGNEEAGSGNGFQGRMSAMSLINSKDDVTRGAEYYITRTQYLDHMDDKPTRDKTAGDGTFRVYGHLSASTVGSVSLTPTPNAPVSTTDGRYHDSFTFDGTDDIITFVNRSVFNEPITTADPTAMTAEAWIQPVDSTKADEQTIMARWLYETDASCTDSTAASSFRLFLNTSGQLVFEIMDTTGSIKTATGSTTIPSGSWTHVAGVLTGGTTQFLTADQMYVFVNGVDNTSVGSALTNPVSILRTAPFLIGATKVGNGIGGGSCDSYNGKQHFEGEIDEVKVTINPDNISKESTVTPLVFNEVNYQSTNEEIEMYMFSGASQSIDYDGYTIYSCDSFGSKDYVIDDDCGSQCGGVGGKVVDPGDIVTIIFDSLTTQTDTSCSGAATTCTWYTTNGAGTSDLVSGDLDAADTLIFSSRAVTTELQARASLLDMVVWGADPGACEQTGFTYGEGYWQQSEFVDVGAISDDSRSICLGRDGRNQKGVLDWYVCSDSIGSLNASSLTSVDLIGFDAVRGETETLVSWQTGAELDTLGFDLYRAEHKDEPKVKINNELIVNRGGPTSGALYEWSDTKIDKFYHYWLLETEVSGKTNWYGPIQSAFLNDGLETKGAEDADGNVGGFSDGGSNAGGNDSLGAGSSPGASTGCGRIASSEALAGPFLCLLLILVTIFATKTHLVTNRDS